MEDADIRLVGDLQRLEVRNGDRFILTVPRPISMAERVALEEAWSSFLGGEKAKLLILAEDMKLGVIGPVGD